MKFPHSSRGFEKICYLIVYNLAFSRVTDFMQDQCIIFIRSWSAFCVPNRNDRTADSKNLDAFSVTLFEHRMQSGR